MVAKHEEFIAVMAVLDEDTQKKLQALRNALICAYGPDTETADLPFHITLGSYAPEDEAVTVSRIRALAAASAPVSIRFSGLKLVGTNVRYMAPVLDKGLKQLHSHFDSDYANGYPDWLPHASVYRHALPAGETLPEEIVAMAEKIRDARITALELGAFGPLRHICRAKLEK